MRRYLDATTPAVSQRYGLALVPTATVAAVTEVPLAPEQCLALATYQYPTSRIHCCPVPTPIAPSDATEFVW